MPKRRVLSLLSVLSASLVAGSAILPFIHKAEAVMISNLAVTSVTNTTATISWNTDTQADALVEYGIGGAVLDALDDPNFKTTHSILLLGLQPATVYTYKVSSADSSGEVSYSQEGSFTTTGSSPPAQPPTTSLPVPLPVVPPAPSIVAPPAPTSPLAHMKPPQATSLIMPDLEVSPPANIASPKKTSPYPTGQLAKEKGIIYLLMSRDGVKVPFTSLAAFQGLGYSLKTVKDLDLKEYRLSGSYFLNKADQEHPWGSCLVWRDGTVYYHTQDGMAGIPSLEVANAIGCTPDKIVSMNKADDAVWAESPDLPVMEINDARIL